MRKNFNIFLILLLAISLNTFAKERIINVPIQYNCNDFKLNMFDSLYYITTTKYHLGYDNDSLAPALPYISVNILIGHDEEVKNISFTHQENIISKNINFASNPTYTTNLQSVEKKQNRLVNYIKEKYPENIVKNITTNTMDGYRFITLHIYPFKYNVKNRDLYFIDSINIGLRISSQNKKANISIGKNMRDIVQNLIINPEDMDILYPYQATKKRFTREESDSCYEYIIVTRDSLKNAFQEFANWKTKKGYRSKILTIEEIEQNYTGKNLQLKIKNALNDYYNGNGRCNELKYVLLGGDVDIVPVQYCYSYPDTIPADIFYACFNIMDWDSNNNNIGGEYGENIDLNQNVFLSRIPIRNISDIEIFTNRNLLYEKEKCDSIYYNKLLMCGAKVANNYTINGVTVSDAQYAGDSIYNTSISPYWNGTLTRLYDTDTSYPEGSSYDFTSQHLQKELEKGYTFVYVGTHGNNYMWKTEDTYGYWTNYARSLIDTLSLNGNGIGTTHIITTACYTNSFDANGPCLSETFFNNPNSGVLTYLGSSRKGWYSNSIIPELGPSDDFNYKFYSLLFGDSISSNYGNLVTETKTQHLHNYDNYLLLAINPLGDPELPIYIDVPREFSDVDITYNGNQGLLYIDLYDGYCVICTTSRYDCGQSYYAKSEYSEQLNIPQGLYDVCITRDGYAPKIYTICHSPYIQNDSFENDVKVFTEYIKIGSNITPSRPEGCVTIEKGKTEIKLQNGVEIKNDFEVKLGAEFSITKDND